MASVSQFSLEEENFYKDIQDLVKKGSQDEKELSTFLQRYMDLLARADLDDESFIINFTKAAFILEASTKVYGSKVDRLWTSVEQVLESLKAGGKAQSNKRKAGEHDEAEEAEGDGPTEDAEPLRKLPHPRRRRRLGEGLTSPDDFLEIDNISGLLSKNMNEQECAVDVKIKFHEQIPNLFIRTKSDRKRIDVCLVKGSDDRDDSRLRDWTVSAENMLVKDLYFARYLDGSGVPMSVSLSMSMLGSDGNFPVARDIPELNLVQSGDYELMESDLPDHGGLGDDFEPLRSDNVPEERNNNLENVANIENVENMENLQAAAHMDTLEMLEKVPDVSIREALKWIKDVKSISTEYRNQIIEALNKSEEIEVGAFPNLLLDQIESYLIDVREGSLNPVRSQEVIPTREMRVRRTNRSPCNLCTEKKKHAKRGKRCKKLDRNPCLDTYFSPLAQPGVSEPPFGILPGEELHSIYKIESKLVEKLGKMDNKKNMYEAYHPENSDEEGENFTGFDDIENRAVGVEPSNADDEPGGNDTPGPEGGGMNIDPVESEDAQLPLPTTAASANVAEPRPSRVGPRPASPDPDFDASQLEYVEIINKELRKMEAEKANTQKNKAYQEKLANWHASVAKRLEEAEKRRALNVGQLATKIMDSLPTSSSAGENPAVPFKTLVEGQTKEDISRYFFSCLQLANEGKVEIVKTGDDPLATDAVSIKALTRAQESNEPEEYSNGSSPTKDDKLSPSSPNSAAKRKRNSDSESSTDSTTEGSRKKATKADDKTEQSEQRKRRSQSPEKTTGKKRKEED